MFRGLIYLLLLASPIVSALAQAGEVFRWTDAQGKVYYSDQPPPASAKQSSRVSGKGNVIDVDKESFASRLAREKNPVVLYANACGPICDQARDHLNQRGIAFTSKDPSKEPEIALELKKLVGSLEVPVIVVGKTHTKGFERSSWDSLLDAAGYPKTPLIPTKAAPPKQP
jgi:glutaredoxin